MIHLTSPNRISFDIERSQIITQSNGVYLRVTTTASEISTSYYSFIRESARGFERRWMIDGIDANLSCRNVQFVIVSRRPVLMTSLLVDIYFPLNSAIDISFQQYTPQVGNFDSTFDPAPIADRQTAAFPTAQVTGMNRSHRPTAPPTLPRQLTQNEVTALAVAPSYDAGDSIIVLDTTPPVVEIPAETPDAQFLRRFDNITPLEEET